jgi:hypothetical protein
MKMNKGRIQIRTKSETNRIHIQGIGDVGINRDYGFATKLRATTSKQSQYILMIVGRY